MSTPRRSVHLHLIGTRGSERRKKNKERTEGQGRVWCFRFYGRLTHCLLGLIFTPPPLPFPPFVIHPKHPLSCLLVRLSLRGSSHVIRSRLADVFTVYIHDNATQVLVVKTRRCTMRQQSGAAPLPAGSLRRLFAIIISSLFPLLIPFLFSSFSLFTRFKDVPRRRRRDKNELSERAIASP